MFRELHHDDEALFSLLLGILPIVDPTDWQTHFFPIAGSEKPAAHGKEGGDGRGVCVQRPLGAKLVVISKSHSQMISVKREGGGLLKYRHRKLAWTAWLKSGPSVKWGVRVTNAEKTSLTSCMKSFKLTNSYSCLNYCRFHIPILIPKSPFSICPQAVDLNDWQNKHEGRHAAVEGLCFAPLPWISNLKSERDMRMRCRG